MLATLKWLQLMHTVATAKLNTTLHAQVLAFSEGQRREEDLTGALVAAVAAARREAGTYGVETSGESAVRSMVSDYVSPLQCWAKSMSPHRSPVLRIGAIGVAEVGNEAVLLSGECSYLL